MIAAFCDALLWVMEKAVPWLVDYVLAPILAPLLILAWIYLAATGGF